MVSYPLLGFALIAWLVLAVVACTQDSGNDDAAGGRVLEEPAPAPPSPRPAQPQVPTRGILPGDAWDGSGKGNLTESQARAFTALDIYWLGPSYAGFNLQRISYIQQSNEVSLIYGSCRMPPCPIPLSINLRSVCFVRPEQALEGGYRGQALQTVRGGALMLESRGAGQGTILWTGDSFVSVNTLGVEGIPIDLLLNDLQRLNRGGISRGQDMPPPDFSRCG